MTRTVVVYGCYVGIKKGKRSVVGLLGGQVGGVAAVGERDGLAWARKEGTVRCTAEHRMTVKLRRYLGISWGYEYGILCLRFHEMHHCGVLSYT